jgi:hypothetical protein
VLCTPSTVQAVAPQHTVPEQVEALLQVMAHDCPLQAVRDEHDAEPVHRMWLVPAVAVTLPMHDEVPEQVMSQVPASQATAPMHEAIPHVTAHDEPPHVTEPHDAVDLQSTTHWLAALQSTATSNEPGTVTEHGMPAGHLGQPLAVQAMTQVPPMHVPAPGPLQREAQSAAATGPPPSGPATPESSLGPVPRSASSAASVDGMSFPSSPLPASTTALASSAVASGP